MMKHTLKFILIGLLCCLCNFTVQAQTRNRQYEEYIHKYKDLAVDEMKRYRIPASITLAQGLLESGAGKSTLAAILAGLLPVSSGNLLVDGQPLTPDRAAAFTRRVGYVPQNPFLFGGTLAENIAFSQWGKPWDRQRVLEVCKLAAIDFINAHPKKLQRPIGENGAGLSGGQAQRVAIARALYARPEVLIFDEATSALDQGNENIIQQTIDRLSAQTTCVIIAHRLSTVQKCDRIIWLDKGHIVHAGKAEPILAMYTQQSSMH